MSKELHLPGGGSVLVASEEEKEQEQIAAAAAQQALQEQIKQWAMQEADFEVLNIKWDAVMDNNAGNDLIAHLGETASAFAGARIMAHQFSEQQAPKVVQFIVQVRTFNEMPEDGPADGGEVHEEEGA